MRNHDTNTHLAAPAGHPQRTGARRTLAAFVAALAVVAAAAAAAAAATPTPQASTGPVLDVSASAATVGVAVADADQPATYVIEYGPSSDYSYETTPAPVAAATGRQSESVRLTGLEEGTTFHYRVVLTTAAGSAAGNDASFTTAGTAPPAPGTVVQVNTGPPLTASAHAVMVAADVYAPTAAVTYYVQFGTTAQYAAETAPATVPAHPQPQTAQVTIGGLSAGTAYHYRVVAVGPAGPLYGADHVFDTAPSQRVAASQLSLSGSTSPAAHGSLHVAVAGQLGAPTLAGAQTPCSGMVGIQIKRGADTIAARRTSLSASCQYHLAVAIGRHRLGSALAVRVLARFQGNALLDPINAPAIDLSTLP